MGAEVNDTPRIRMIAGPNGSGKSTLKQKLEAPGLLGVFINPDDIEQSMRESGFVDLATYQIHTKQAAISGFFEASLLLRGANL